MEEKTVSIPKISCGHCVLAITRELGELPGVLAVDGDPATRQVVIRWQAPATWADIAKTLNEIGYPAQE